ncbi:hypothetical protein CH294_18720 [Rhodococcus sp. 14-2483-1-1]|uniref:barstar family protein n=1 Tax=Rhodococcus sp. 14-2483-1-1 TaxID=2023148 RepID=UPI000B9A2317|nr:barstar family protein [Rhodococcus sp. 14-2483-1-1]OZF31856.1 hypothetical protein CH294_18720 [Rhodococcus sp. 14-2483-1-1]
MPMPPRRDQPANTFYKPALSRGRSVIFDPTDHELFVAQQQGFDWQLLQNGSVHRYADRFSVETATGHLSDLNYRIHSFDAGSWGAVSQMYSAFAASMSFPDNYGQGLDAFNDVLSDIGSYRYGSDPNCRGTVLAIADFDSLAELDRHTAIALLDIFARQARLAALYGHAMLCLIESADENLGRVGGSDVHAARVFELPPDPPEPFDESIIVEFGFQFYATDSESRSIAAAVASAAVPVLEEVGRYETRTASTSERAGQFDEIHSSSGRRRRPGQHLFDINIAVRGRGDRSTLGEAVFHAVTAARLPFEQMYETAFSGHTLDVASKRYPLLALP